jgi:hypothetical protein
VFLLKILTNLLWNIAAEADNQNRSGKIHRASRDLSIRWGGMEKIKKILLIFAVDTFIMIISWAGLSLIIFCIRALSPPQATLVKILSLYSFFIVMFCYALYLAFDLCEFFSSEIRTEK